MNFGQVQFNKLARQYYIQSYPRVCDVQALVVPVICAVTAGGKDQPARISEENVIDIAGFKEVAATVKDMNRPLVWVEREKLSCPGVKCQAAQVQSRQTTEVVPEGPAFERGCPGGKRSSVICVDFNQGTRAWVQDKEHRAEWVKRYPPGIGKIQGSQINRLGNTRLGKSQGCQIGWYWQQITAAEVHHVDRPGARVISRIRGVKSACGGVRDSGYISKTVESSHTGFGTCKMNVLGVLDQDEGFLLGYICHTGRMDQSQIGGIDAVRFEDQTRLRTSGGFRLNRGGRPGKAGCP